MKYKNKFLGKHILPKLTQDKIKNMSIIIKLFKKLNYKVN